MNYFQIKVTDEAREALDAESRQFLGDLGWFEEEMARWTVIGSLTAEDYFEQAESDVKAWLAQSEGTITITMHFAEMDLTVDFLIREVPTLVRQGNSDKGYIVSDDIAFQMERELSFIAEEAIPPNSGEAVNWFRTSIKQFQGSN